MDTRKKNIVTALVIGAIALALYLSAIASVIWQ